MSTTPTLLSITGIDSTGQTGVLADLRIIQDLGAMGTTVVASLAIRASGGQRQIHALPTEVVIGQMREVLSDKRPSVIKLGMITQVDTLQALSHELQGGPRWVCHLEATASDGTLLMNDATLRAYSHFLLPGCSFLLIRSVDAERLLGYPIVTESAMLQAARDLHQMGADWVFLRNILPIEGGVKGLLYHPSAHRFVASTNTEGWQKHGVGGALSTAIATRLAWGDDVTKAVQQAHAYLRSRVVYTATAQQQATRPAEIYNQLVSLMTAHYREHHDIQFYADQLAITPRYLAQVTRHVADRTPKNLLEHLLHQEAQTLLRTTALSIQEVSHLLGYPSQVAFARFFRQQQGTSPSVYRFSCHPQK